VNISESYKKRIQDLAGITKDNINDNFKQWFGSSKVINADDSPAVVHHGTDVKFKKFNLEKATQGIIWFTSNKGSIEAGESGAQGRSHTMDLYASIKKSAGWEEYARYGLGQLRGLGYDGAILPDAGGSFVGFVFEPTQLKSVNNDGSWDSNDKNIYS